MVLDSNLAWTISTRLRPPQPCHLIKWHSQSRSIAIAEQNDWLLYHFDVKQAFVEANLDTDVYMKLQYGCGERTGKGVKLDRALYGI